MQTAAAAAVAVEAIQQAKLYDILDSIHPLAKAIPKIHQEVRNIINLKRPYRQGNWCKTSIAYNFFDWNSGAQPDDKPQLSFFLACLAAHDGMSRSRNDKFTTIVFARGLLDWVDKELRRLSSKQVPEADSDDNSDDKATVKKARRHMEPGSAPAARTAKNSMVAVKREASAGTGGVVVPEAKRTRYTTFVHVGTQAIPTYRHAQTQTSAPTTRETPTAQAPDPAVCPCNPPSASTTYTLPHTTYSESPDAGSLEARIETTIINAMARSNEAIEARIRDIFATTMRPAFEETGAQHIPPQPAHLVAGGRVRETSYRPGGMPLERPVTHTRQRLLPAVNMGEVHGFASEGTPGIGGGGGGGAGRIIEYPAPGPAFEGPYDDMPMHSYTSFHPYRRGY